MKNEKFESREEKYYESIKEKLEELIKRKFDEFYLEITANKHFSNKLKAKISRKRDIIFSFLKEAAPDITGYVKVGDLFFLMKMNMFLL